MKKIILTFITLASFLFCQEQKIPQKGIFQGIHVVQNIPYVTGGGLSQQLDLYLPEVTPEKPLPVIVWIHGGSWKAGDKKTGDSVVNFVPQGYIGVSMNYRLSSEAVFPAQIEDCKSAIRWLRAHSSEYHLDQDHIAVFGVSAGGHLAALLGTSGNVKEFDQGENLQFSSKVQAVCDFYGPTDFLKVDNEGNFEKYDVAGSAIFQLMGGFLRDRPELCAKASPISHVAGDNPPFLIIHGDKDLTVPIRQSELLVSALKEKGVSVIYQVVSGGDHGGKAFNTPEIKQTINTFFEQSLKTLLNKT
ncbi:MAG: alpha/beta hydrolase [Verrucomicrobiota bacterium]